MMDRYYGTRTQSKYTVRLLCVYNDIMADEQVWAEDGEEAFRIAEKQHDEDCHTKGRDEWWWSCDSEAWSWEEGWLVEEVTDGR